MYRDRFQFNDYFHLLVSRVSTPFWIYRSEYCFFVSDLDVSRFLRPNLRQSLFIDCGSLLQRSRLSLAWTHENSHSYTTFCLKYKVPGPTTGERRTAGAVSKGRSRWTRFVLLTDFGPEYGRKRRKIALFIYWKSDSMAESSAAKAYKYRQEISQVRCCLLSLMPEHFRRPR